MGLPNEGDKVIAKRLASIARLPGCPIGASISAPPEETGEAQLQLLGEGICAYIDANVDFIEINESCPNTAEGLPAEAELASRLRFVRDLRSDSHRKSVPFIFKFSVDTELAQVEGLVSLLVEYGFDGINFGNTSTAYAKRRNEIDIRERPLFDYFTGTFGGGVSGKPLAADSLALVRRAAEVLAELRPPREFHIIRTGGIRTANDVAESLAAGASLAQWYTGYFEAFGKAGHIVYDRLYNELLQQTARQT